MPGPLVGVPPGLLWWRTVAGGAEWLRRLPALVSECAEQWSLEVDAPYEAHVSFVAAALRHDGTAAVLKVNFPDEETEREPDALALWDGDGAVRMLAYDEDRRALLLERCLPGTTLRALEDEDEANRIAARLLRGLWRPPLPDHRFRLLAEETRRWALELPRDWEELGRPFEQELLDEAVAACRDLGASQGELVVLHQDFHGGNVLRSQREPWLVIDPKPLVGEREFDAASLLRDRRWTLREPDAAQRIRRRLDLLASELTVDRARMRLWGIVHALAWGVSGRKLEEDMVACARWLAAAGD